MQLLPDDSEVLGLLALMLLTDARTPARTTGHGELVPMAEQDRTLWNADSIRRGTELLVRVSSSPVVRLSHAVAVGPSAPRARAHMLERSGDPHGARAAYAEAAKYATNLQHVRYLNARAQRLGNR